ncbi:heterokaryon incompatibility protein-domain-containing protein [Dichomitus squalens]|uniref:Heterokaryon incompatibility protein-domain-containing protein n=1 Tax=Dichomitus squalens TaxID=114155 RepID=A0A4Q9P130_9APHY|nr:heterokaryon incompatibility protein-domain-containing protein [Dichomitus squalens]TBU63032.1 heterokaryon incompatibility protein-domain-containing protein [Dichomitus squalens]
MRVLDTWTGQFMEVDPEKTNFAILSHTWRKKEQTYNELKVVQARHGGPSDAEYSSPSPSRPPSPSPDSPSPDSPSSFVPGDHLIWNDVKLSRKIREACGVARKAGYRYLWIDSCCINKASSSELSESINSMFQWYGRAKVCFAHLADVPSSDDARAAESAFRKSRWFERGWTLQELIAPLSVKFLSEDWTEIGTKLALADLVEEITGIAEDALVHAKSLDDFSVAQRLSWTASRKTSRKEDSAYSLLGIFNINMSTLYGEGERAFRRLLEEIVRRVPDQSVFAWGSVYMDLERDQVLADSLSNARELTCVPPHRQYEAQFLFDCGLYNFTDSGMITVIPHDDVLARLKLSKKLPAQEYTFTPHGIRTQLPVVPLSHCLPHHILEQSISDNPVSQWYLVILGCEHPDHPGALLGRVCYIPPSDAEVEYLHCGRVLIDPAPTRGTLGGSCLFPLSPETIDRCRNDIQVKTVYISHPERATAQSGNARYQPHEKINLLLPKATRDALRAQGYTAKLQGPDERHPGPHWLTLLNDDHMIAVEYLHTLEDEGWRFKVKADVKMSRCALDLVEADPSFVEWEDSGPWYSSLRTEEVAFTLAGKKLILKLGLDLVAQSHYFLRVELVEVVETEEITPAVSLEWEADEDRR